MFIVLPYIVTFICTATVPPMTFGEAADPDTTTAWLPGFPEAGLNEEARSVMADFKTQAMKLQDNGQKLRILIIGDSLSDGYYHWSHYFRQVLQRNYGDGGIGNVNADMVMNPRDSIPGLLFDPQTDFNVYMRGQWKAANGLRGDVWPYLGWNGKVMSTDSSASSYEGQVNASQITLVYSRGTFTTHDGQPVQNRAGGFTVSVDGQSQVVEPATEGDPLDVGFVRFDVALGMHDFKADGVHDGWLWLHGLLLENEAPGIVVYNIANGGWWPYNYLWRQPGFEKTLKAMNPDLIIYFLTKPDSESLDFGLDEQGLEPDYRRLMERVSAVAPDALRLHIFSWNSKSGSNPVDLKRRHRRLEYLQQQGEPILNLFEGLDRERMAELGWYKDNIHLAQPGGAGIGLRVVEMFLNDMTPSSP